MSENQNHEYTSTSDTVFGSRLKQARELIRCTQEQLAESMTSRGFDFTQATVYKIENGKRKVTVGEALAIASILATDIEMLTATADDEFDVIKHRIRASARELFNVVESLDNAAHAAWFIKEDLETEIRRFEEEFGESREIDFGDLTTTPRMYFQRLIEKSATFSPSGLLEDSGAEKDFGLRSFLGIQGR